MAYICVTKCQQPTKTETEMTDSEQTKQSMEEWLKETMQERLKEPEAEADKALHPLEQQMALLEERGVLVIDDVRSLPMEGEPYVSPHLVIGLNHSGQVKAEYDMQPVEFGLHDISVVFPNHIVLGRETSADYRATLVVVSGTFLESLRNRATYRNHLLYLQQPHFHLTDEQYAQVVKVIDVMRIVTQMDCATRTSMQEDMLAVFSQLLDEFRTQNSGVVAKRMPRDLLFSRFCDAIVAHHRESHEVRFYANLLCLSPKYFATVIKRNTGIAAGEWISNYIIIQAKSLLKNRQDMNVQQVGAYLGFPDQASFSRYFRHFVGMSPKEYRKS